MADEERIVIICDEEFKRKIKSAILEKGIAKFSDGYKTIMELGLKEFNKGGG